MLLHVTMIYIFICYTQDILDVCLVKLNIVRILKNLICTTFLTRKEYMIPSRHRNYYCKKGDYRPINLKHAENNADELNYFK
jgi:hypothetical protein